MNIANIFENAKFGDRFKTRDGRMVIYWNHPRFEKHELVFDGGTWLTYSDNGRISDIIEDKNDIVSKWNEPIEGKELDDAREIIKSLIDRCLKDLYGDLNISKNHVFSRESIELLMLASYHAGLNRH